MNNGYSHKKGFTLIELIITIAILAILGAIGIPSIIGYFDSGKEQRNENVARTLFLAAQNALTDLNNRGQLETLIAFDTTKPFEEHNLENGFAIYHQLQKENKLDSSLSIADSENNPYLYYVILRDGDTGNPMYQLLAPYVGDQALLSQNICIEFNAKTAMVKSAFYSEEPAPFAFHYGGTGDDSDLLVTRETTTKIGYYGAETTGSSPMLPAELKVQVTDGRNSGELANTLYVEAFVPNNEDSYTITLTGNEDENGNSLEGFLPFTDSGKPLALTFKVNGSGRVSSGTMAAAMGNPYTDLNASAHAGGITHPVFRDTALYDPFGTGTASYVKVTWVIDTVTTRSGYRSVVSKIKKPQLLVAELVQGGLSNPAKSNWIQSHYEGQSGTTAGKTQKYFISNTRHLNNVRYALDGYFVQNKDITIRSYDNLQLNFEPIGSEANPFTGFYTGSAVKDGKQEGLLLKGLHIDSASLEHIGLFGVNEGTVEWLELEDISVRSGAGAKSTGVIAGTNHGSMHHITLHSAQISASGSGIGAVAGINDGKLLPQVTKPNAVVQDYGVVSNCAVLGTGANKTTITVTGAGKNIGGAVGLNYGLLENTTVISLAIDAPQATNVGGVLGCNNGDKVVGSADWLRYKRTIQYAYVTDTTIVAGELAGGIVGINSGSVKNVFFNYASTPAGEAQIEDFICPIKVTRVNAMAGGIAGASDSDYSLFESVYSTALMNGRCADGTTVSYQPLVGGSPKGELKPNCMYLTGRNYNSATAGMKGTAKSYQELVRSTALDALNNTETAWFAGSGAGTVDPYTSYPYPVLKGAGEPFNWPTPSLGNQGVELAYYERYAGSTQYNRYTMTEDTLLNSLDVIVVEDGYQLEFYTKQVYEIQVTNAVTHKKTGRLPLEFKEGGWYLDNTLLKPEEMMTRTKTIGGQKITYSALKLDFLAEKVADSSPSLGLFGFEVFLPYDPDNNRNENVITGVDGRKPAYAVLGFAKDIFLAKNDTEAKAMVDDGDFRFYVRSPRHMRSIDNLEKTSGRTFKQELTITLTTANSKEQHQHMSEIQRYINEKGALIAKPFEGTYDGVYIQSSDNNRLTIRDFTLNPGVYKGDNAGLFKKVGKNGTILSIRMVDAVLHASGDTVGGIAAVNLGTVRNVIVEKSHISGTQKIGGAVGINEGKLESITSEKNTIRSTNTGDDASDVGGVVAINERDGRIFDTRIMEGTVEGGLRVGGIAGTNKGEMVIVSVFDVNVSSGATTTENHTTIGLKEQSTNVGGIAGLNDTSGKIACSRVVGGSTFQDKDGMITMKGGAVYIHGVKNVGGIVGENKGGIMDELFYYDGNMRNRGIHFIFGKVEIAAVGNGATNVGGIAGNNAGTVKSGAVFSTEKNMVVIGNSDAINVGGLVGLNTSGTSYGISDSFVSAPSLTTAPIRGKKGIGGLVGVQESTAQGGAMKNLYYAALAPTLWDTGAAVYYPISSSDTGKLPNLVKNNVLYMTIPGRLNDRTKLTIIPSNRDAFILSSALKTITLTEDNSGFSKANWSKYPIQANKPPKYPYPVPAPDLRAMIFPNELDSVPKGTWIE